MGSERERRQHARQACDREAALVVGGASMVFVRLRDLSAGGASVSVPRGFRADTGDLFGFRDLRTSRRMPARVVGVSTDTLHLCFA